MGVRVARSRLGGRKGAKTSSSTSRPGGAVTGRRECREAGAGFAQMAGQPLEGRLDCTPRRSFPERVP